MDSNQPKADGDQNIVHLSPDMLPAGTAPKPGDRLTFVVSGEPDGEAGVPGYFEPASEQAETGGNDDAKWADDFKSSMSPTAEQKGM